MKRSTLFRSCGRLFPGTNMMLALIAFVSLSSSSFSQDKAKAVDSIFNWATPQTPGCACAVAHNGKVVINRAYGSADLERNIPLTPESTFDAGSLVKQFVAASVLLLVEDKRLALTDDIRKYIPELPDYGHIITIDHLLTHTSGIRDWTGIAPLANANEDALTIILRQRHLNFVPGQEWSYSNSGYVLLKELVSRVTRIPFSDFVQKSIFGPLGMQSTSYRNDLREVVKNRAMAYDRSGSQWKMAVQLDNDRGGGGALFTTAGDLLIWNDALTRDKLGKFVIGKMTQPATLNNHHRVRYTRGLFTDTTPNGSPFWWHSGSADGYKSLLARFPEQDLSISIMCNSGDNTDKIAFAIRLFELFGKPGSKEDWNIPPPIADKGVDTSNLQLESKAGLFFNESTGLPLRLIAMKNRMRFANGSFLVATGNGRFRRNGDDPNFLSGEYFNLQFLSKDQFTLIFNDGRMAVYNRAHDFSPGADDLTSFTGRYHSDEIGATFKVEAKESGLLLHLENSPGRNISLKPADTNVFQFNMITVRFNRDKAGKTLSLDFSNPMLRNARFTRIEDTAVK